MYRMFRFVFPMSLFLLLMMTASCGKERSAQAMKMNSPRNIRGVSSYKGSFGDLNDTHLVSARQIGIDPLFCRKDAEESKGKVFHVFTNRSYKVDSLTHSIPYLVPQACLLLYKIGCNFQDSLGRKGLNPYRVIVTSVLRTKEDVKRLRKRNVNASLNSAHFYGTTFDIAYNRFDKIEEEEGPPLEEVRPGLLKQVLAEVLRDLKKQEACYVKYELKQGCFHVTAR